MKMALKIWRYDPLAGERALREYEVDAGDGPRRVVAMPAVGVQVAERRRERRSLELNRAVAENRHRGSFVACEAIVAREDRIAAVRRARYGIGPQARFMRELGVAAVREPEIGREAP